MLHVSSLNLFSSSVIPKRPSMTASTTDTLISLSSRLSLTCNTTSFVKGKTVFKFFKNGASPVECSVTDSNPCDVKKLSAGDKDFSCRAEINGQASLPSSGLDITVIGRELIIKKVLFH